MVTFTELRVLCAESIFLKYSGYFLPLLLFILTKHVWKRLACVSADKVQIKKEVIDISKVASNIQTDPDNDELDDEVYKPYLPERDHIPYRGITVFLDKSGEHFYKVANNRRSVRKFSKNKPVEFNVIKKCILTAGKTKIPIFRSIKINRIF